MIVGWSSLGIFAWLVEINTLAISDDYMVILNLPNKLQIKSEQIH